MIRRTTKVKAIHGCLSRPKRIRPSYERRYMVDDERVRFRYWLT